MKINEILTEGKKGHIDPDHAGSHGSVIRFRDVGGYDRVYHLLRLMQAAAAANGTDIKKVDTVEQESWIEKYNTAFAYTEADHNMMLSALKTIDSEFDVVEPWKQSHEPEDTWNRSPINARGPIKLLKKGEKPVDPPPIAKDDHGYDGVVYSKKSKV